MQNDPGGPRFRKVRNLTIIISLRITVITQVRRSVSAAIMGSMETHCETPVRTFGPIATT